MAKIIETTQSSLTLVFARFGFNNDRPNLRPRDGAHGNGGRWYDRDVRARGL
jgi:hypothetical protein